MRLRGLAAILFYAAACHGAPPIAGDGTLGTAISRAGNAWSINGGTQLGGNLFQSFARFNVLTGHSATFHGPGSVQHIVGRVTGGSVSSIDGVLRSAIPGASLWLMNPKGVMFGPNASLDVSGSFHVTTADHLKLGASGQFNATHPGESTLASAPPSAFGFLGPAVAPITVNGATLQVPAQKEISVLGGDVTLTGATLLAPDGRITIGGGQLAATGANLHADSHGAQAGGGLSMDIDGDLRWSGGGITSRTYGTGAAGALRISANRIYLDGGASVLADSESAGRAGDLTVHAGELIHASGTAGDVATRIRSGALGTGPGGAVLVTAPRIELHDGARIAADNVGGAGATATVRGGELVRVSGSDLVTGASRISAISFGGGTGGQVLVEAPSIEVVAGGRITADAESSGQAGNVEVKATQRVLVHGSAGLPETNSRISSYSFETGDGGSVTVRAPRIEVLEGGLITTATAASGWAGSVTVIADELLRVQGHPLFVDPSSIDALTQGSGRGGSVVVRAQRLELLDGGRINADTGAAGDGGSVTAIAGDSILVQGSGPSGFGSRISAFTLGAGKGGEVSVETPVLRLAQRGELSSRSSGSGDGGRIVVTAGTIELDGGVIETSGRAGGLAGNIDLVARDRLRLEGGSRIASAADSSGGGSITIKAGDLVYLNASQITTSVRGGAGDSGNISIDPTFVVLIDSQIIANAFGGNGGNISIVADNFLTMNSLVQASSALGLPGNVQIAAPKVDVSSGLATLNASYLDASSLMRESCAARAGRSQANSFTGTGRGGLAQGPGALGAQVEDKVSLAPQIRSGRLQLARAGCD